MTIAHPEEDRFRKFYQFAYGNCPPTFTYIVSCAESDFLKFGKSNAPQWRLLTMQTGCPFKLTIEWAWPEDIEDELHEYFADRRILGEWFRVSVDEAISVAAMLSKAKCKRELGADAMPKASDGLYESKSDDLLSW